MEIDGSIPPPPKNRGFFTIRSLADPAGAPILFASERVLTLGRRKHHSSSSSILLDHRSISRRHVQLFLDGSDRKLRLLDGFLPLPGAASRLADVRRTFRSGGTAGVRVSSNGVLVNGRMLGRGGVAELFVGDEVLLGCSYRFGNDRCGGIKYGFVVDRIVFSERNFGEEMAINKASVLLSRCRSILGAADPISNLRNHPAVHNLNDAAVVIDSESFGHVEVGNARNEASNGNLEEDGGLGRYSHGKTIFLNRLEFMGPGSKDPSKGITLPELLHPVQSLVRVFVATFTSDVPWFLSYCQLPNHLPITIACHSAERCWSASRDSRTSAPFVNYPNLLLVYPPFPEVIAFGKDRKKQGVACHHPKLIVLQRKDSVRVVVTSANLVSKQWNHITNTVWWQDFPSREAPDYSSYFCTVEGSKSDFAAHLAGFIAYLISDVPSQAHWITELAKYDFGSATCHLVASIPGMHVQSSCYAKTYHFLSAKHIVHSEDAAVKFLGSVQASVVGLSHRFHGASDFNGAQLRILASVLGTYQEKGGTLEVILKRNFNIPADTNAVSVFVTDFDGFSDGGPDGVQLGFLPREVAKWVSPLSDIGFFDFSAIICPKETLEAVLSGSNSKVPLLLIVSQGPKFSEISSMIRSEDVAPLCSLLASIQRRLGLWRLQEVLSPYKWPESLETDFVYGSSSIGTSVSPQFIAAFSSAAGKRSFQTSDSQESDPEWGCWTISHESRNPSIRILYPTIERVKNGNLGIQACRRLLALSEKTWLRLKPACIFHDAIPHPDDRLGYPMHVKVARRRFQSKKIGIPPFGWIYSGSHNFSPAAWGQITSPSSEANALGPRLRICNYELGVVFVVPPSDTPKGTDENGNCLDNIPLPFLMPAPKYQLSDRPATALAMRHALAETAVLQREISLPNFPIEEADEEIPDEEEEVIEVPDYMAEEKEEEKIYAEMLWGQVDSSES